MMIMGMIVLRPTRPGNREETSEMVNRSARMIGGLGRGLGPKRRWAADLVGDPEKIIVII